MSDRNSRRRFMQAGVASAGMVPLASAAAQESNPPTTPSNVKDEYDGYSRYKPSRGADPNSPYYIGKMVPGFRSPDDGPAPFVAPFVPKLPYTLKNGVKEFILKPMPVAQEFLPGNKMNVYGYNGSMPGPTIEVTQGDRVRVIVENHLPEPTFIHFHGFECLVQYDGAGELIQDPIPPGGKYTLEFDVREAGSFFYHPHVAMQEGFGMVGWVVVHPKKVWDPPVDRDFGLVYQNFFISPNSNTANTWKMDWNWNTINGRSGPHFPPLVCKHGERVRIRIMNFSPMQHHPIHLHGHTFWVTGHEGARAPHSAWVPRNTELIAIAQVSEFEFIANNPGDWMFHCHMVHHMGNHMTEQVGPRMRPDTSVDPYLANLDSRPAPQVSEVAKGEKPPGYPQWMVGMSMSPEFLEKIWEPRETKGMRSTWPMSMAGLMTGVRVLPEDLYHRVMETDEDIPKGAVYEEIIRRFGDIKAYNAVPKMKMKM